VRQRRRRLPRAGRRGVTPDLVTEQTAAHDPLVGYIPPGFDLASAAELRARDPQRYVDLAKAGMRVEVEAMLTMQQRGAEVFDYGNNIRTCAMEAGVRGGLRHPRLRPRLRAPLFCEGKGPFRWVALSGDPEDILETDRAVLEAVPHDEDLARWLHLARGAHRLPGPPRAHLLARLRRPRKVGLAFNELVRTGKVKAPIVIGRDHLDCGSVASPNRETEAMKDGSDAIADWPILNALANTAGGASG
jgi:urocanate hydratase